MSLEAAEPLAPVSSQERLNHVDALRGVALLGVLLMNIQFWFRAPMQRYQLEGAHPWSGWWNIAADVFLETVMSGKAMTLFAMLFAVGLAIQYERATAAGRSFSGLGARRLGLLFGFGLLHLVLVWNGDILHNYALVGFLLLAFLPRKPKTILIWLGSIVGLAVVAILVACAFQIFGAPPKPRSTERVLKLQTLIQEILANRGSGTWLMELKFRLREWLRIFGWGGELGAGLDIFFKFLIGLAIWKTGIIRNPEDHLPTIRRMAIWGIGLGLVASLIVLLTAPSHDWPLRHWSVFRWFIPLVGMAQIFGTPVLALGWGAGLLLLVRSETGKRLLHPFSLMGRMAFTHYLTQSLVMTFVFFGWGLGLYNKLGPAMGMVIGLSFFSLQMVLGAWWLRRFRFGPMEWVWRTLTYGKAQPMRLRPSARRLEALQEA